MHSLLYLIKVTEDTQDCILDIMNIHFGTQGLLLRSLERDSVFNDI